MKYLKKKNVAILVMVAAILLSCVIGVAKKPKPAEIPTGMALDTALDTAIYADKYIVDEALILSEETEKQLALYNANWDEMKGSILAVVTVSTAPDGVEDAAWQWGVDLGLSPDDAVLLVDGGTGEYYMAASGFFYDLMDSQKVGFLESSLYTYFHENDYNGGLMNLFGRLHLVFSDVEIPEEKSAAEEEEGGFFPSFLAIALLVLVLIAVFTVVDMVLFSRWNRTYGGLMAPPVIFQPILPWHRPGSEWYRKRRAKPAPTKPVTPGFPGGFAPKTAGGVKKVKPAIPVMPPIHFPKKTGGSTTRSGGFGSSATRPGGFSSSASRSSTTTRSGSFGSASRSNTATRTGGFSGSRGGGFGSSTRSGGFGGSRGGGFGGKR